MLSAEIEEKVIAAIRKNKRIADLPIGPDSTFEDLKLDSLEIICTVFDLEDAFSITIPDDAAKTMHSVRDVVEGVAAAIGPSRDLPANGPS